MEVMTVTGAVPAQALGFCQCHEHLLIAPGKSGETDPALCFDDLVKSTEEVFRYKKEGGVSLVEAQPLGCGRMASGLVNISQKTGLLIVASTGFHKMKFYPDYHWIFSLASDRITELYLHELSTGMFVDGDKELPCRQIPARAGIVKTALDSCGLTAQYEKLFCCAADASLAAGVPILIHIEKGSRPLELFEFLCRQGISPERLIFCHLDRACPDPGIHRELAGAGCYLEYDTIGRFKYHSDEEELTYFQLLKKERLLGQLLFSLDTTRLRLKAYSGPGAVGLDYILRCFVPLMRRHGFADSEIRQIAVLNPQSALCRKPLSDKIF